jgi:hypothetical protein
MYVRGVSMSELIVYLIESGLLFSEMAQQRHGMWPWSSWTYTERGGRPTR